MKRVRILRALVVVLSAALASSASQAAIDISEVEIAVEIEDVNEAGAEAQSTIVARVVVRGSGITSASITPSGSTSALNLLLTTGGDFVLERSFVDETELAASLPAGQFVVTAQAGQGLETRTATLSFERLVVPSPAISEPAHQSVVPAGALSARFTACATCTLTDDTTVATLEQGSTTLASETLEKGTATDWVPADTAGPLQLPPGSAFTLRLVHTASRSAAVSATPSDAFTFRNRFSRSDEVQFSTGFLPPEGNVCVVVNDPDGLLHRADEACKVVSNSSQGILDVSGSSSTVSAGIPIEYGLSLSPSGRLSGVADADLDSDGAFETHAPLQGRLRGSGGRLRQTIHFSLEGGAAAAGTSLRVSILERALLSNALRTRKQATKGDLLDAPVSETRLDADSIASLPTAWRLDFHLAGEAGRISGATLTLAGGRTVSLMGRHRFSVEFNRTNVRLKSRGGDKGVEIEADGLRFNDAGTLSRGEIRWRGFGQDGRLRLRDG